MSSRIIRGDDRVKKLQIFDAGGYSSEAPVPVPSQEQLMHVEKQGFEQGYKEGERIGKQMGERMVDSAVKRYDRSLAEMAIAYRSVVVSMETRTVQLAIQIAQKIVQREVRTDPDLISALAAVALRRVQGHQEIVLRVSRQDYPRLCEAIADVNPSVVVKEEVTFERGDFVIDSSQTHIDGRLQNQVDVIGRALLEE